MVRLLRKLLALAASFLPAVGVAHELLNRHETAVGLELGYVHTSGCPSWTDGSVGKLRHGSDGAVLNRLFVDYEGEITETLNAHIVLDAYDEDLGNVVDSECRLPCPERSA